MNRLLILILTLYASPASAGCDANAKEAFPEFLSRFISGKAYATNRTIYPHVVIRHEYEINRSGYGKDLYKEIKTINTKEMDASFPPLADFMKANSMEYRQKTLSSLAATVDIFKPNTDWILSYHFTRIGNCWYLKKVEVNPPPFPVQPL
jgi:hypothetical protein